jgi:HK97 family phage major capsid protein
MLDNLTHGPLRLPRAIVGGSAAWLAEIGPGTPADQNFDSFTATAQRIHAATTISRQLVVQSSPDIEAFIVRDLSTAIGVAVDNAALNGSGVAPVPLGILHYPVNTSGSYTYASRSANVTFGGAATWPNVLAFEKILEAGLIVNDGSYGYATDPTVRDKWQQVVKLTGFPSYLWENTDDPDDTFGRVNGRRAISSTQLPAGSVVFGKWSEMLICSWIGIDVVVDPFSLAHQSEIRILVSLLADVQFRYPLAFCASSDSGAQ